MQAPGKYNNIITWFAATLATLATVGCGDLPQNEIAVESEALYQNLGHCPAFDDNSACLCTDINLGGYCQIYQGQFGYQANPANFTPLPNDSVSSVAIGAVAQLHFFNDSEYGWLHGWLDLAGNNAPGVQPTVQNSTAWWGNDFVSSFRLAPIQNDCWLHTPSGWVEQPMRDGTARVYVDSNYGPGMVGCAVLAHGDYPSPTWAPGTSGTFGNFGLHNDAMSSVRVAPGTMVRLWRDAATIQNGQVVFAGPHVDLTSDTPDLSFVGFNDTVSAVQVF